MFKTENTLTRGFDNGEDWQVLFYSLLESAETCDWVDIDEHLSCKLAQWDSAELYDSHYGELFTQGYVMCCEDEEEFAAEMASGLLKEYRRYVEGIPEPVQCVEQANCWQQVKPFYELLEWGSNIPYSMKERIRAVYENCVAGLYYGDYGFETLMDNGWNYELPRALALELWRIAFWYLAEGFNEEEVA